MKNIFDDLDEDLVSPKNCIEAAAKVLAAKPALGHQTAFPT
jgi:hypothetical protein